MCFKVELHIKKTSENTLGNCSHTYLGMQRLFQGRKLGPTKNIQTTNDGVSNVDECALVEKGRER